MKKRLITLAVAGCFTLSTAFTTFAGEWKQDTTGWWYQNDDGSYPVNTWQWIDGDGDGTSENYYFDGNGYCLMNTVTPDGMTVNGTGAWVIDGVLQTQAIPAQSAAPETPAPASASIENTVSADQHIGSMVWLSATGSKFHKINNCGRMNPKKARQISYEKAVASGYTPCSKCY